ncbi:MAG: AAA family ATPase [Chlamydiota bacterium]
MQKLPIGISEFSELREKNCVYVDKTKYIYDLLNDHCRVFLSRPRRFGKSLLLSTLAAALHGKKELFKDLWIANSDHAWKPVGVIRFDFSELSTESGEDFKRSLLIVMQRIANQYGVSLSSNLNINAALGVLIDSLCNEVSKKPFESVAVLIDEYDHPILHTLYNLKLAVEIRDIMKSFACVIKARSVVVKFVFVTGVSAFSKSDLSSGLNNLTNLTMNKKIFDVCGYTDKEVDLYFKEHINAWKEEENIPYETLREDLKSWYNGYCFKEKLQLFTVLFPLPAL